MLEQAMAQQVREHLTRITQPVVLAASLDETPRSRELRELLEELAALSPLLSVQEQPDERTPSFAIRRAGTDVQVRFGGIPMGHEFTSLVLALLWVGGHASTAPVELQERVRALTGEHHFTTYMSLSCQNCPEVVQALNLMSVLNPNIHHTAVDGGVFPGEVEELGILAVPTVLLDGEVFGQGRMSLEQLVAKLDDASGSKASEALTAKDTFDVLVVGAGPAGVSSAIYAARKGIRTGLVAERLGGQVLDTMAIENFISVPYTEGPQFGTALEQHVLAYEVDLMTGHAATGLLPAGERGVGVTFAGGGVLFGRTVVLATGARWRTMGVPGEDEYRNKGVTFCPHCDGPLFKGKRVAVIGGGNSGVEAAIDLAGVTGHVTVLEFDDRLRADEVLQRKLRSLPNVDVIVSARTTEVVGDGSKVTGLRYEDRAGGGIAELTLDGVFVQIGLLPNTEWLHGAVELTERGEIVVDGAGATSAPGVFAAGDATTAPFKQIVTAMGSGATAALSAFDHLIRS